MVANDNDEDATDCPGLLVAVDDDGDNNCPAAAAKSSTVDDGDDNTCPAAVAKSSVMVPPVPTSGAVCHQKVLGAQVFVSV